jgi:D-alanyl-D-alanine carboxypeptidase/D-alanyl-D-alanine endopeptidase (penicillin-binding protein 7)
MKYIVITLLLVVALAANAKSNVTAKSFLVTDIDGEVILEKNADQQRPIASITKLMTAMVVLDANQDLDEVVPINFKMRSKYHTG